MAFFYVVFLFLAVGLIFVATLIIQTRAWLFPAMSFPQTAQATSVAGLITSLITAFLAADREGVKTQLKSSPTWVRAFVGSAILYAPTAILLRRVFYPDTGIDPENLFVVTAVTLALGALSLGILHAVLWAGALQEHELIERSRNSSIAALLICGYLIARHAGLLAPKHRIEMP